MPTYLVLYTSYSVSLISVGKPVCSRPPRYGACVVGSRMGLPSRSPHHIQDLSQRPSPMTPFLKTQSIPACCSSFIVVSNDYFIYSDCHYKSEIGQEPLSTEGSNLLAASQLQRMVQYYRLNFCTHILLPHITVTNRPYFAEIYHLIQSSAFSALLSPLPPLLTPPTLDM